MTKLYSLDNLHAAPRKLRDLSETEIKGFYVGGSTPVLVVRQGADIRMDGLSGSVSISSNTLESEVQSEINCQLSYQKSRKQDASSRVYGCFGSSIA